jgi:hypothetical protein
MSMKAEPVAFAQTRHGRSQHCQQAWFRASNRLQLGQHRRIRPGRVAREVWFGVSFIAASQKASASGPDSVRRAIPP